MKKIDSTSSLRVFVKPQATVTEIEAQQVICASTTGGIQGKGDGSSIIGNGGNTSGGSSAGFDGVDAKRGNVVGMPKMQF